MCLLRPGGGSGWRSLCGPPVAAAAGSHGLLPVEEEEGSESVRGVTPDRAFSPSMLRSGDTGVSELLDQVRTTTLFLFILELHIYGGGAVQRAK